MAYLILNRSPVFPFNLFAFIALSPLLPVLQRIPSSQIGTNFVLAYLDTVPANFNQFSLS